VLIPALVGSLLSLGLSFRAASWFVVASAGLVVIGALGSSPRIAGAGRVLARREAPSPQVPHLRRGIGLIPRRSLGSHRGRQGLGAVAIAAGPLL